MFGFLISLFWWALILLIVLGVFAFRSYNKLQALAQGLREAASNTEVAISRKLSLVNQLIDVVRNYQDFEQFTHLKISGDQADSLSQAWTQSGQILTSIQGMAQRYPELRASEQYTSLAASIQLSEQAIMDARERYNGAVRSYNTTRGSIPTIFVARVMDFAVAPYLEFDHAGVAQVNTLKDFKTDDGERLQQLLQGASSKLVDNSRAVAASTLQAGRALQERLQAGVQEITDTQEPRPLSTAAAIPAMPASPEQTQFFYMQQAGGVPQGPLALPALQQLLAEGTLGTEAQFALVGSSTWQSLSEWQATTQSEAA